MGEVVIEDSLDISMEGRIIQGNPVASYGVFASLPSISGDGPAEGSSDGIWLSFWPSPNLLFVRYVHPCLVVGVSQDYLHFGIEVFIFQIVEVGKCRQISFRRRSISFVC